MFLGVHEDLHAAMYKCVFGGKEATKKASEEFIATGNKFLKRLEELVPESGFVLGKETPTIADLALYDLVVATWPAGFKSLEFDMKPYEKITALVSRVTNILYSDITLTYFEGAGRAEISRLILHAGNVKFNDVRHSFESWAKVKANK